MAEPSTKALPTVQLENVQPEVAVIVGELKVGPIVGQNRFRPGDVLFSKLRPYLAKSLLVETDLQGSPEFLCMRPSDTVDSRYLMYLTLSQPWLDHAVMSSYGSKMPRTSWEQMASFRVPTLEREAQVRIAEFLNDRVTRIDRIIASRSGQVERVAALPWAWFGGSSQMTV